MLVAVLAVLGVAYAVVAVVVAGHLPEDRPHGWAEFASAGAWGLIWPVCLAVVAVVSALPAAIGWAGTQVRDRRPARTTAEHMTAHTTDHTIPSDSPPPAPR